MSLGCSLSRVLCTLTRQDSHFICTDFQKSCRLVRNTIPMTMVTTSRSGGGKVFGLFVVSFGLLLSLLLLSLVAGMQSWWWWWWCVSLSSSSSSSLPPSSCCYYVVLLFPLCCCCCRRRLRRHRHCHRPCSENKRRNNRIVCMGSS